MSVIVALFLAAQAPALSTKVEISAGVIELSRKYGKTNLPEFERGLKELEQAGDRTASVLLGELLMQPDYPGGPDMKRSCDQMEKAGHHPEAQHNLATCYFSGNGRLKDLARSRELYRKAAEQGYAKAACAYGNMLIRGLGGAADVPAGLELCRRAADAGIADSQTDYGGYLLTGQFLTKDANEARRYLSLAANEGHPNAAFLLGQIYWNGDGIERDLSAAERWFRVSFTGGRADAAKLIGGALIRQIADSPKAGKGVTDGQIDEAKKWFGIAAEQDPDPAERRKAAEAFAALAKLRP